MTPIVVGVTGASGFVGRAVAHALTTAGHRVVALGRQPVEGYEFRTYELSATIDGHLLDGLDVVVHAAYDLTLTDTAAIAETNVQGARVLAETARTAGVRPVLVSSMSAYDGTRQSYGQSKLASERAFLAAGGEAVRLGLVWGGAEGGMIGTLRKLARLPVIPMFGTGLYQYTVHVDDMASGLATFITQPRFGHALGLAHPARVGFEHILSSLAPGGHPRFLRFPWRPTYGALGAAERFHVPLPVRADSLLGLVRAAPDVPHVELWGEMGVQLRAFPGMSA